jgi:hypothetical protein
MNSRLRDQHRSMTVSLRELRRSALFLAPVVLLTLGYVQSVQATTMRALTVTELVQRSQKIVQGTVAEIIVSDAPDGSIWTRYRIDKAKVAKGQLTSSGRFYFRCRGGQTDKGSEQGSGIPTFNVGEEVVIFYAADNAECQVVGWVQGSFHVARSPEGRRVVLDKQGRLILGFTANGLVRGDRPTWAQTSTSGWEGVEIIGASPHATSAATETGATAEDFFSELTHLARALANLATKDQPSEGTTEPYPPPRAEEQAATPTTVGGQP